MSVTLCAPAMRLARSAVLVAVLALGAARAGADIVMSPYLQAVDANGITVLVECNSTANAAVDFGLTSSYGRSTTTTGTVATSGSSPASWVHRVKLTGLSANTVYHYRARHGTSTTADSTFRTAVAAGTGFRLAFLADFRTQTSIHDAIAARVLNTDNPAVSLYGGDLCNDSAYATFKSEFFLASERALAAKVPFFNAAGNHEGWSANTQAFTQAPASGANGYYSLDYGDVHVLVLNNQVAYDTASAQYSFAQSDLAATTRPWKIVTAHNPAYCAGGHGEDAGMKTMTTGLFEPNKVDLVLTGHSHFYQHNLVNGIPHLVIGSVGAPLVAPGTASYVVKTLQDYCYGILDVTPTTLDVTVYNDHGTVLDTLHLSKATPVPTVPSGLAATAVSTSQINLAWTDNAGNETGFKIERKTGSAGTYAQVATTGANVTSWSNTGLAASTTYYYRVRANNAGGDSGYSNEASATTQAPPPPPPPTGSGIGLRGEYFDNADFTTATLVRTDATVNFDWGSGSPDAALAVDSFSARWSGAVQPQYSETYTFFTTTDDGVRLWVDGKLLIDKWVDQGPTEWSGTVALTAGKKVDIRMDYYENGGGASAKLAWSSPSRAKEIIPQAQLYPWSGRDIGSVGVAGSDTVSGTNFTVKGSGADIWNNADAFHYVYQVLTGDGEIKARVASVESTDPWAKAGVMVRESLNADARHAMAVITPGYGFAFQRRTAVAGASTTTGVGGIAAPYWVRMVRQGNNFSAYRSADGNAWSWVGTETIGEGSPEYVGLAVTSHNNTVGCTSQIDNVTTATSVAPAGALVTVTYVSTVKPYSLATAKVGALPFIDRTYTITAIPSALNGGVLVRTANDDKGNTNSSHLTLRLGQAATVYVVYDKTGTLPGWLGGWTLRGDTVTTTDAGPSPMRVYQKSVAAGDLVLGGNLQSPASGSLDDYFVVVQPTSGKALPAGDGVALMASAVYTEGPIPADRWQHEGDADGDGLRDDFEPTYALDSAKPDTDGDGTPDEGVRASDGRTLWEVQEGVNLGAASDDSAAGDGGGTGSKCGSFGLDLMAPLALLWLARRRRRGATHRGRPDVEH